MTNAPDRAIKRPILKAVLPSTLNKPLSAFAKLSGASPFAAFPDHVTKEMTAKAQQLAGGLDPMKMVSIYKETGNPIWLWMSLNISPYEAVPAEVNAYLRTCANQVFNEVVGHLREMDRIRIEEGKSPEEGITRQPSRRRDLASAGQLFQLSHVGRNPIQEAAKDLRAIIMTIGAEELTRNRGVTRDEAYAALATLNGYATEEKGPAVTTIRKIVNRGRKLLGLLPSSKR